MAATAPPGPTGSKADHAVDKAADRLQEFANKAAAEGGLAAKIAPELAEDAAFLRKLKPSLIVARAKGELRRTRSRPRAPSLPSGGRSRPRPKPRGKKKGRARSCSSEQRSQPGS